MCSRSHRGPEGSILVRGASQVAGRARFGALRGGGLAHPALIDGVPGVLVTVGGRPVTVFTVTRGAITEIRLLADPGRLAQVVPSWVA
jgi:RNA polymerase sigma-70 factor, ECF subfamily